MKVDIPKDWCLNMAKLEDGQEIGAGSVGNPEALRLQDENFKLRSYLAHGSDPCVYCGLPKADIAMCELGFPGCGRADDMLGMDDPWPRVRGMRE